MMKKTLPTVVLGVVLAWTLAACTSPVGTTSPSPGTGSPAPGDGAAAMVDRDPQGLLPTIADTDGIPTLTAVTADPPAVITVKTLQDGAGATVGPDDFLTVNYAGFLWSDGSQFDSSFDAGESVSFPLADMMDGWRYGLAGTTVGDRVLLVVPPEHGYGDLEDEVIPPNSTLVFVVDILNATTVTTAALADATPTGAALPEGLTISGELGQEPTLTFAADAPAPTEAQTIVIAQGSGPVITETDTLLYHVAGAYWGEESSSTWGDSFEQEADGGGEDTIGQPVGSRLLLLYPADEESGIAAEVVVLDLLAVIPSQ